MDPVAFVKIYEQLLQGQKTQQKETKPKRKGRELSENERAKVREQLEKNRLKGLETRRKKAELKSLALPATEKKETVSAKQAPTTVVSQPTFDIKGLSESLRKEIYDSLLNELRPKTVAPPTSSSSASSAPSKTTAQSLPLQQPVAPRPPQASLPVDDVFAPPLRRRPRY